MAAALAFSPIPEPLDYPALADEWGELRRRLDLMKPDIARLKVVEAILSPLFELLKAEEPGTVEGREYRLLVSPRENHTEINDIAQVRRAMTAPEFLSERPKRLAGSRSRCGKKVRLPAMGNRQARSA